MNSPFLEIPDTEADIKEAIKIGHKHGLQNAEQAPNVIYILRMLSDQYVDLQKRYLEETKPKRGYVCGECGKDMTLVYNCKTPGCVENSEDRLLSLGE